MNEPYNTKKIIMIGAGGLAVEIYSSLVTFYGNRIRKNCLGCISNEKKEQVISDNKRIIGNDTYLIKKFSNINVIIAIGNILLRKKIYNKLKKKNFFFPNIYSPNLNFKLNKVKIGKGNIFCNNSIVRPRVSFGNFNISWFRVSQASLFFSILVSASANLYKVSGAFRLSGYF